jgi:hypothetical protein
MDAAGAMAVTDAFLATFNAGDARGHAETLGYPHVRLRAGWDHSEWDHRRVIQGTDDKVHLDVQFTRYRADGSVIGVYPAVYVVVLEDAGWRIQCRSSFAP